MTDIQHDYFGFSDNIEDARISRPDAPYWFTAVLHCFELLRTGWMWIVNECLGFLHNLGSQFAGRHLVKIRCCGAGETKSEWRL